MTREDAIGFCQSLAGAVLDSPFEEDFDSVVARHGDNRKWFALFMMVNGRPALNLKCDPMKAEFWRGAYEGVTAAWHMNKVHWNTVWLDMPVPDADIFEMINDSYLLTAARRKR